MCGRWHICVLKDHPGCVGTADRRAERRGRDAAHPGDRPGLRKKGAGHRHLGGGATGVAWQGNDLPVLPPSPSFVPFANL